MTLRTVTFDPAQYKLMPLEPTQEMTVATYAAERPMADVYRALLSAVPYTLSGVVEHSGEPVAVFCNVNAAGKAPQLEQMAPEFANDPDAVPLFTHAAPVQPVEPNDRLRDLLRQAEDCMSCAIRIEQVFHDKPPMPVSEWDYNADQLVAEIQRALSEPAQPVERQELSDAEIMEVMQDVGTCWENDWADLIHFARAIIAADRGQA